ncbi:hypothetical protein CRM22_002536 [Opisthorchis felineus]|uniref:tRNA (uracil(54)-C(5))-methyltransferase n=1 Tax=Opisthorchis felineus TaxID=147828 RepID=A0A4S2M5N8_OPIFE|nr:hypothetical protein CRM22_002536 [Opisthorchis felineus]
MSAEITGEQANSLDPSVVPDTVEQPNINCDCFRLLHTAQPIASRPQRPGCDHPDCPYQYLQRDTFTSEAYKIQLKNIHKYTGFKQLKKLLDSLNVKYRKVKLLPEVTFITFCTVEDRDAAIAILDGYVWRGKSFEAKVAIGKADPLLHKRHATADSFEAPDEKRTCVGEVLSSEDQADRLRDIVTPLYRLPYNPDQLLEKSNHVISVLALMRTKLIESNPSISDSLLTLGLQRDSSNKLCACPLLEIVPSPITAEYRNKSELTIGCDLEGQGPIVGFRLTKYRDGLTAVGSFNHVDILPKSTVSILDEVQRFIDSFRNVQSESRCPTLTTYDPITHSGHWRHLLIRESRLGDLLLLLDIHPQQLKQEEMDELCERFRHWFIGNSGQGAPKVTSLYFSTRRNTSERFNTSNTRLLFGKDHIVEKCCGLEFQISLDAFFQINTLAAELLYEEVSKFASGAYDSLSKTHSNADYFQGDKDQPGIPASDGHRSTCLLDICCGTGTIALCLSKHFDQVIGIELVQSAVADAKQNATRNGIGNAQFYAGQADKTLLDVMSTIPKESNIVAVVDPPRSGIRNTVIQTLRRCTRLERIVYVSCNLEAAMQDFIDFARPTSNRFQGAPFIPTLARPVDLFPQTRHVEVVILLQRIRSPQNS